MHNLYLTSHVHVEMPYKMVKEPRNRFVRYYNDLFDMEGIARPDAATYLKAGQYSYSELGDAVLALCQDDCIVDIDLFVIAYWGHEFDPNGSFGAYLAHRHNINARMFDICDQGILSPISAIKIIHAFFTSGKANKAALLCFDQTSIPVEQGFSGVYPSKNSAHLMIFESTKTTRFLYKVDRAYIAQSKDSTTFATGADRAIIINPSTPCYSCAELFTPLLNSDFVDVFDLIVLDYESGCRGILTLTPEQGLRQ